MPFRANPAKIASIPKCLQLRILFQKLPGIILSLISNLRLPGMYLSGPVLGVWLERRHLVRIVLSSHKHLNETLFNVLLYDISLSLHRFLKQSIVSLRTSAKISCMDA